MQPIEVTTKAFSELTVVELHDVLRLRGDVFVVEQACAYADIDGRDREPDSRHHWIDIDGSIAVYARTLADSDGTTRIGRVVTAGRFRGDGLAARLVTNIIETSPGPLVLDAQVHLVAWYEHLGFEVAGREFTEDGIAHVTMARRIGNR